MIKHCRVSIALSTLAILVTLFASGCIGESDAGDCDTLEHVSEANMAEGVDPCGNEDDADADAEPVSEDESPNLPALTPASLCLTPSCNRDP